MINNFENKKSNFNKKSGERRKRPFGPDESGFEEKVIEVSRVSRTVKGGKRIRFRALVVVGNRNGKVGMGIGKAQEVMIAVQKASRRARKNLINVPIYKDTIPHETKVNYGSSIIFFKPASAGTSVIAGGSVRPVIELAGIKNILTKIIGSPNKINNVTATLIALKGLKPRIISNPIASEITKDKGIKDETPTVKKTQNKKI